MTKSYISSFILILLPFLYFIIGNFYDLNLLKIATVLFFPIILFIISFFLSNFLYWFSKKTNKKIILNYLAISIFFLFNFRLFNFDKFNYLLLISIMPLIFSYLIYKSQNLKNIFYTTLYVMLLVCTVQIIILNFNYYFQNSNKKENFIYEDKIIEKKPNIYSLTLDAYSRSDMLSNLGFDNSYFEDHLEKNNFFVAKKSYANFPSTYTSMYTFWTMEYPDINDNQLKLDRRKNSKALLGDNITINKLKSIGYKHIRMGPNQAQQQDCSGYEDHCLFKFNNIDGQATSTGRSMFVQIFLMTPLDYLLNYFKPGILDRNVYIKSTIGIAYDSLKNLDIKSMQPFFLELNVWQPHGPYTLDQKCNLRKNIIRHKYSWVNDQRTINHYLDEVSCVNSQIIKLVEYINLVDNDAYIFITSDHGHGFYTDFSLPAEEWSKESANSRISNFWAAKLPHSCKDYAYDSISLVNTFRVMFACLYKEEPILIKDRGFIHTENIDKDRNLFQVYGE